MINVKKLNYHYGTGDTKEVVLRDIELRVKRGELVVLNGPSGSGKTTLLTIIGALRKVDSGRLIINQQNLIRANHTHRDTVRRSIGYIFQHHNLISCLTALQNVCMSLELGNIKTEKARKAAAMQALREVGMQDKAHSYPEFLSGGQKQRISIARAIASTPKIILADEPTASLDKKNALGVIELLKGAAKDRGASVVVVTHDPRWFDAADRVIRLEEGYIHKN